MRGPHLREDPQIIGYLKQCRLKYPGKEQYRGIVVGTAIPDKDKLARKVQTTDAR